MPIFCNADGKSGKRRGTSPARRGLKRRAKLLAAQAADYRRGDPRQLMAVVDADTGKHGEERSYGSWRLLRRLNGVSTPFGGVSLGVPYNHGFAKFVWREDPDVDACTVWAPFDHDTAYFGSNEQQAMINFRVDDLDALLADLAAAGVEIVPERSEDANGRVAWITDPEGNRVELWSRHPEPSKKVSRKRSFEGIRCIAPSAPLSLAELDPRPRAPQG